MNERLRKNNGPGWIKVIRTESDHISFGNLSLEEFGFLNFLRLKANPHSGFLIGNHSTIAEETGLKVDRVRYLCRKLRSINKIYYKLKQGHKGMVKFYMLGMELVNGRVVSKDNIKQLHEDNQKIYEVGLLISKSLSQSSSINQTRYEPSSFPNSDVTYKEKEKDKEKKNEKETVCNKKNEINLSPNSKSLKEITQETLEELKKALGEKGLKDYLEKNGYVLKEMQAVLSHRTIAHF